MTKLKEYLKQACALEQDIYEKTERLKRKEEALSKLEKNVSKKKEELKKEFDALSRDRDVVGTLLRERISEQKEGLFYPILTFVLIAVGIVLYHIFLNFCITDWLPIDMVPELLIGLLAINIVPSIIIGGIIYFIYYSSFVWCFVIPYAILQAFSFLLSVNYISDYEKLSNVIFKSMTILLVLELIVGAIICVIINSKQNAELAKRKAHNQARTKKLNAEFQNKKEKVDNISRQIEQYNKVSLDAISNTNKKINDLKGELTVDKIKLMEHYSQGIIHPKYRNWVAVATIYEYLDTGICNELSGPNGAYKFYEEDLRAQRIAGTVDELRRKALSAYSTQSELKRKIDNIILNIKKD